MEAWWGAPPVREGLFRFHHSKDVPPEHFASCSRCYHSFMDWISVTDRLPPTGKRVLACSWMSVNYFVAYVSPLGGWCLAFGDSPILNVTHWMPLPELPQGSVVV